MYQEMMKRVNRHLISKQAQKEGRPCMPPLRIIRLHFLPRLEVFIVMVEREGHGAIRTCSHRGGHDIFFHRSQRAQQLILFHGRRP